MSKPEDLVSKSLRKPRNLFVRIPKANEGALKALAEASDMSLGQYAKFVVLDAVRRGAVFDRVELITKRKK